MEFTMPRTFAIFSLLGLAAVTPALAAPHGSVPLESFLNYHASSVRELSQEVTLDPAVRTRLARHFHVTPKQMTAYVGRNLVLTRLKTAGTYRVACVRADGSEYWVHERLAAGTPVFASRATGKPILKLACGNPMVSALPPGVKVADSKVLYTNPKLASIPSTLVAVPPPTPLLATAAAPQFAFNTDALTVPPVVQVAGSLQSIVPVRGGGGFPLGYLAGIPVLAGIIGHGGGSGSSSSPFIPPIVPPAPAPGPTPVPETSTVASLGLLLGGLSVVALRRKRLAQD